MTAETTPTGSNPPSSAPGNLAAISNVVVLMLENRSFDHMLGHLYAAQGNVSPSGQPFEGGSDTAPASGTLPTMAGFVKDYAYTIGWEKTEGWTIVPGTTANEIMGCFTPQALPVLSALAQGYAVCDHWYSSAPTETLPNRAFALAGTSQGVMDDKTKTYTCPSIFGSLAAAGVSWMVYGYDKMPLTRADFPDIASAPASNFGLFAVEPPVADRTGRGRIRLR